MYTIWTDRARAWYDFLVVRPIVSGHFCDVCPPLPVAYQKLYVGKYDDTASEVGESGAWEKLRVPAEFSSPEKSCLLNIKAVRPVNETKTKR